MTVAEEHPDFTVDDVLASFTDDDQETTVTFLGPVGAAAAKKLVERLDGEKT